jgi:hypothetical protein
LPTAVGPPRKTTPVRIDSVSVIVRPRLRPGERGKKIYIR